MRWIHVENQIDVKYKAHVYKLHILDVVLV